jgi:hypothetical protein
MALKQESGWFEVGGGLMEVKLKVLNWDEEDQVGEG